MRSLLFFKDNETDEEDDSVCPCSLTLRQVVKAFHSSIKVYLYLPREDDQLNDQNEDSKPPTISEKLASILSGVDVVDTKEDFLKPELTNIGKGEISLRKDLYVRAKIFNSKKVCNHVRSLSMQAPTLGPLSRKKTQFIQQFVRLMIVDSDKMIEILLTVFTDWVAVMLYLLHR